MNLFVAIDGVVKTPRLDGTILPGVTRDACLTLLRDEGVRCEETDIALDEVMAAAARGGVGEAFGTGTAAIIAPISAIGTASGDVAIPAPGPIARRLKERLSAIQEGRAEDPHGFRHPV